jgi:hypothetical protein
VELLERLAQIFLRLSRRAVAPQQARQMLAGMRAIVVEQQVTKQLQHFPAIKPLDLTIIAANTALPKRRARRFAMTNLPCEA